MGDGLKYLKLLLLHKTLQTANFSMKCLLLALGGVEFFTEKPFYQQLRLEGRSAYRTPKSRKVAQHKMCDRFRVLERNGFVEKRNRGKRFCYVLTKKGELLLLRRVMKYAPRLKNNERIFVSYDIPEDFKVARDLFRRLLYETGFRQCHKSILICERDVEVPLLQFVNAHKLDPWVKIIRGRINTP